MTHTDRRPEKETDAQYWIGSRYAPTAAKDRRPRSVVVRPNDGPDADYLARKTNPGTIRAAA